jgi:hypothetical protein
MDTIHYVAFSDNYLNCSGLFEVHPDNETNVILWVTKKLQIFQLKVSKKTKQSHYRP